MNAVTREVITRTLAHPPTLEDAIEAACAAPSSNFTRFAQSQAVYARLRSVYRQINRERGITGQDKQAADWLLIARYLQRKSVKRGEP